VTFTGLLFYRVTTIPSASREKQEARVVRLEPNVVDPAEAQVAQSLRKECDANNSGACGHLSQMYREGRGVTKDREMARQLLRRAIELAPRFDFKGEEVRPDD
jgi:TPR repeat protein